MFKKFPRSKTTPRIIDGKTFHCYGFAFTDEYKDKIKKRLKEKGFKVRCLFGDFIYLGEMRVRIYKIYWSDE